MPRRPGHPVQLGVHITATQDEHRVGVEDCSGCGQVHRSVRQCPVEAQIRGLGQCGARETADQFGGDFGHVREVQRHNNGQAGSRARTGIGREHIGQCDDRLHCVIQVAWQNRLAPKATVDKQLATSDRRQASS